MDPDTNTSYKADLRIRDGIIARIAPDLTASPGEECLDAEGFVIAPGLIDTHTHFRDPGFPHKETLHTGALAAARGGFTSVICMANTSPAVDSVPVLQDILERAYIGIPVGRLDVQILIGHFIQKIADIIDDNA